MKPHTAYALVGIFVIARVTAGAGYKFDSPDEFLADARLWPSWHQNVQKGLEEELVLLQCVADPQNCPKFLRGARIIIERGKGLERRDQLKLVNRYVNGFRRYRRDRERVDSEVRDVQVLMQWSTLFDFLKRGGDCDDFATAKYQLLRAMGFEEKELRVLVVFNRPVREYHALLAVHFPPGQSSLLDIDNRIYRHRPSKYKFTYALNAEGIWNHGIRVRKRNRSRSHNPRR